MRTTTSRHRGSKSDRPEREGPVRESVITSGYAKGDATREALLNAATREFSRAPYDEVTTRQITEAAGLSLTAIKYYFGNKRGLYAACAETLIKLFQERFSDLAVADQLYAPEDARKKLKQTISTLVDLVLGEDWTDTRAGFFLNAFQNPGPAFNQLYDELWGPGIDLVSRLIANINGRQQAGEAERIDAIGLISNLSGYTLGSRISFQALGWRRLGPPERQQIKDSLHRHINAI